jgi:hypothetical protein
MDGVVVGVFAATGYRQQTHPQAPFRKTEEVWMTNPMTHNCQDKTRQGTGTGSDIHKV